MAVSAPYLFQAYYETLEKPNAKRIWSAIIKSKGMVAHLPMVTEDAPVKIGHRIIDQLPTVQATAMGQEPAAQGWQPSREFQEGCFLYADNFPFDTRMLTFKNHIPGGDLIKVNSQAYLTALALYLDDNLINGNRVSGPLAAENPTTAMNSFTGLKYRILDTSGPYGTSKWGVNPACNVQSQQADLTPTSWSPTNAGRIWLDFDRVMSHMGVTDGTGLVCYCAPQTVWLLDTLARVVSPAAAFSITKDVYGRTIGEYKGMQIVECTLKPPALGGLQVTPIISVQDDINGWGPGDPQWQGNAGGYFTSFYFVKRSSTKGEMEQGGGGLTAWQVTDPDVRIEHLGTTRQSAWMYDMTMGLFYEDTRAIARLYGVKVVGPTLN